MGSFLGISWINSVDKMVEAAFWISSWVRGTYLRGVPSEAFPVIAGLIKIIANKINTNKRIIFRYFRGEGDK